MKNKLIVISAVNLVEAGTLAILQECLSYLSVLVEEQSYRVIAIVYDKKLAYYSNIEYIETKWPKKRWLNRLWYEYVSMNKLSKKIGPVYLWLSLHDTSPTVVAERRAVYCHNSYFSYKWKWIDLFFAPKIALFAIFTKLIYKTNIRKNDFLIVQQNWFKAAMIKNFGLESSKIIVARPESPIIKIAFESVLKEPHTDIYSFIFAGSPNSHKNFEVICKAVKILEENFGLSNFRVTLTVKGDENKYASWLFRNWGYLNTIDFRGFVSKDILTQLYAESNCLIYSSKVESWGLPISEFSQFHKPMLLADLPYAHETAAGSDFVSFFNADEARGLAEKMMRLIKGDVSFLKSVPIRENEGLSVDSWKDLFSKLLG